MRDHQVAGLMDMRKTVEDVRKTVEDVRKTVEDVHKTVEVRAANPHGCLILCPLRIKI